ncbi:MAG: DUF4270 domain-containing protein [Bacteroidia bacterium]|nr:DUF4270 domain-containing protein [Bacteroidia bacterium]
MKLYYLISVSLIFILGSCGDSIQLGSTLLEDPNISVSFTDTFHLKAKTISSDVPPTFRNSASFGGKTYMVGAVNDPVFGYYGSVSYFTTSLISSFPDFSNASFDSIVLSLPYDSVGFYGNKNEEHLFELYQLSELFEVESGDTLYSDMVLEYDENPLSQVSIVTNYNDSIALYSPVVDSIVPAIPQLRMHFDTSFWSPVARDTLNNESNEALNNYLKGFAIKSVNAENSMVGFDLGNTSQALIEVYYTIGDTAKNIYFIDIGTFRHSTFEHDFTGTPVGSVTDIEGSDETLYLQSMAGTNVSFDLSGVEISDEIINKAVLEITVSQHDEQYEPITQLLASYINDEGRLNVIEDASPAYLSFLFDGALKSTVIDGITYNRYEMVITNHLKNIMSGQIDKPEIVITGLGKQERPNRSVLFGPSHPEFPAILKIITTNP